MSWQRWPRCAACLQPEGLAEMQAAGCLAFADDLTDIDAAGRWSPAKAWLVLDPTGLNVSARRLDGLPWNCCHGAKSRCVSGPGSKSWPVGLMLAKPGQRLDVVEGEGDFLALWHLHAITKTVDAAPVGLLGSCANLAAVASKIAPHVAGRTVQIFAHRDATSTGQIAAQKWADSFYRLGASEVRIRDLTARLGGTGKDLNDAIAADAVRRRALTPIGLCPACFARDIIAPLNGPTCSCRSHVWPQFTEAKIQEDIINP